jgi:hypothetical protein
MRVLIIVKLLWRLQLETLQSEFSNMTLNQ